MGSLLYLHSIVFLPVLVNTALRNLSNIIAKHFLETKNRLMAIKHETLVQQDQMDSFQTLCMLSLVAS